MGYIGLCPWTSVERFAIVALAMPARGLCWISSKPAMSGSDIPLGGAEA